MPDFVNYNNEDINFAAISAIKVGDEVVQAQATTDQLHLQSGGIIELEPDCENKAITIKHPETHPATMIETDSDHRFVTDVQIATWNANTGGGDAPEIVMPEYDLNVSTATNGVNLNLVEPTQGNTISIPIVGSEGTTVNGTANGGISISSPVVQMSTTTPLAAGTASAGSSTAVSRGDHVHPVQTSVTGSSGSCTGNAATATTLQTVRTINGMEFDGSTNIYNYGTCSTAGDTAAKVVDCAGFKLETGSEITVRFNSTNTAENATLNVNSTGAKAIRYKGDTVSPNIIKGTGVYTFRYTGSVYDLVGEHEYNYLFTVSSSVSGGVADQYTDKLSGFKLYKGQTVNVLFSNTITHGAPTLNVSMTGAYNMKYRGANITSNTIQAGTIHTFIYDGSFWQKTDTAFEYVGGTVTSRSDANTVITLDNKYSSANSSSIKFMKNGSEMGSLGFTSTGILKRFTTSGSTYTIHDTNSIKTGKTTITPDEGGTTKKGTITFSPAFTSVPKVFVSADSGAPSTTLKGVTVTDITTSSATIALNRSNTTATTIYWLAIE